MNVNKSKVMVCNRRAQLENLDVRVEGERLEEVDDFKYLGGVKTGDASIGMHVCPRVNGGMKVFGAVESEESQHESEKRNVPEDSSTDCVVWGRDMGNKCER